MGLFSKYSLNSIVKKCFSLTETWEPKANTALPGSASNIVGPAQERVSRQAELQCPSPTLEPILRHITWCTVLVAKTRQMAEVLQKTTESKLEKQHGHVHQKP